MLCRAFLFWVIQKRLHPVTSFCPICLCNPLALVSHSLLNCLKDFLLAYEFNPFRFLPMLLPMPLPLPDIEEALPHLPALSSSCPLSIFVNLVSSLICASSCYDRFTLMLCGLNLPHLLTEIALILVLSYTNEMAQKSCPLYTQWVRKLKCPWPDLCKVFNSSF